MPNTTLHAMEMLSALVSPLSVDLAERRIEELVGSPAVLFASGRGALVAAIGALGSDEVALPAYTCAAVANAVVSAGRRPIYVDVDERGLVPPSAWPRDRLAIVQDTYGFRASSPAEALVIRDAAHRPQFENVKDAAVTITSFEQSKWLSTGQGGLALTADGAVASELRRLRDSVAQPKGRLQHTLVTLLILVIGRLEYKGWRRAAEPFIRVAYKVARDRLAGQTAGELGGSGVDARLLGRPNSSVALLIISQIKRARAVEAHRSGIVALYDRMAGVNREAEPLLRYPMRAESPGDLEARFLEQGWDLRGRWFSSPVHPPGTDLGALGYVMGSAPNAEDLAASVINLPTHLLVSDEDAQGLIDLALRSGAQPLTAGDLDPREHPA